ncbi:MAG: SUMF1/EgtB/PvdO family nonheme iron enzyme [Candidatus Cloacimonetes bacterium]|nr:SUMF1/EgtB/PvdO family nonheme iron enzyme [Candidatus Cloacimonadota bacterium]
MSEKLLHPNIEPHVTIIGDKYLVVDQLRSVANGAVYTAEPINGGKSVVLKILFNYPIQDEAHFASMEDQFFQYVEIDNPYLPKAIELIRSDIAGISGVYPILVFKKRAFTSSRKALQKEEHYQFEPNRAMDIIRCVCSALQALHEKGIFHGNLSSSCISVNKKYEVIVWDFFLFGNSERVTVDKMDPDKLKYTAPDLFNDAEISMATDIYAVGCLLHEYLEGETPFVTGDQKEQHLAQPCLGLNVISSKLNKFLLKAIAKQTSKRHKSYQVMLKALNKMIKVKALGGGVSKSSGGKVVPILIIIFIILALAGGGYFYLTSMVGPSKKKSVMRKLSKKKKPRRKKRSKNTSKGKSVEKVTEKKVLEEIAGMIAFNNPKFSMGSDYGEDDSQPAHDVELSSFYIDQFEVSNDDFKKYVVANKAEPPVNPKKRFNLWNGDTYSKKIGSQPVINIKWQQAVDYCEFVGKRLPTEAEWEFAARGANGRQYPWGAMDPDPGIAQFDGEWGKNSTLYEVDFFEEGKTPEGVYNMLGGVREWVSDWYADDYYENSERKDPKGPSEGTKKVLRGGSWEDTPELSIFRDTSSPDSAQEGTGFRCAKNGK